MRGKGGARIACRPQPAASERIQGSQKVSKNFFEDTILKLFAQAKPRFCAAQLHLRASASAGECGAHSQRCAPKKRAAEGSALPIGRFCFDSSKQNLRADFSKNPKSHFWIFPPICRKAYAERVNLRALLKGVPLKARKERKQAAEATSSRSGGFSLPLTTFSFVSSKEKV